MSGLMTLSPFGLAAAADTRRTGKLMALHHRPSRRWSLVPRCGASVDAPVRRRHARQPRCGAVELVDRHDQYVKLLGFRIGLEEIEQSVMAARLAVVVVVEKIGEDPAAVLTGFNRSLPAVPFLQDTR